MTCQNDLMVSCPFRVFFLGRTVSRRFARAFLAVRSRPVRTGERDSPVKGRVTELTWLSPTVSVCSGLWIDSVGAGRGLGGMGCGSSGLFRGEGGLSLSGGGKWGVDAM